MPRLGGVPVAGKVRLLDEITINQIAAGEVVERPASVLKELVENALDAGARRIQVEIRGGGAEGIEVVDDGGGMSFGDLRLAIERHATSKIASASDLEEVVSLGFRGEALPSMAAVSCLEVVTRDPEALAGSRLVVRGGRVEVHEEAGCPAGTRVAVTDLFFNTPARRKYMKGQAAELDRCMKTATALALARPEVAFRVRHNGRETLSTPGTGRLWDAVVAAYGAELAGLLLPVSGEEQGMRLGGYVAAPSAARASRSHQHFFVNQRAATGYPLSQALEDAFEGLVMTHRHPVAFLELTLDPRRVDVNVHPAKLRVRFQDEAALGRLVRRAVAEALAGADLTPSVALGRPGAPAGWHQAPGYPTAMGSPGWVREAAVSYGGGALPAWLPEVDPGAQVDTGRWPALRVIGQVARTYILAEGEGGLYIIDQHAAHERLNFEAFRQRVTAGGPPSQPLATPLPIQVGAGGVALWQAHRERLSSLGFHGEPFGADTVLLREVPVLLGGTGHEQVFRDLMEGLATGRPLPAAPGTAGWEADLARLAMASCKASVKAHDPLSAAEMENLLERMAEAENPFTCPHGRPTILQVTHHELERHFKRV